MAKNKRIYAVESDVGGRYLVRATNRAQAVRFAARGWTAKVADQETLLMLRNEGVAVEDAVDDGDD